MCWSCCFGGKRSQFLPEGKHPHTLLALTWEGDLLMIFHPSKDNNIEYFSVTKDEMKQRSPSWLEIGEGLASMLTLDAVLDVTKRVAYGSGHYCGIWTQTMTSQLKRQKLLLGNDEKQMVSETRRVLYVICVDTNSSDSILDAAF